MVCGSLSRSYRGSLTVRPTHREVETCDRTMAVRPAIITASAVYTQLRCCKLEGHDGPCMFKRPDQPTNVARPVFVGKANLGAVVAALAGK